MSVEDIEELLEEMEIEADKDEGVEDKKDDESASVEIRSGAPSTCRFEKTAGPTGTCYGEKCLGVA